MESPSTVIIRRSSGSLEAGLRQGQGQPAREGVVAYPQFGHLDKIAQGSWKEAYQSVACQIQLGHPAEGVSDDAVPFA